MAEETITQELPVPEAQEPKEQKPRKRATIASLGADFKTLESFMDEEIIPAIELIEDRVNKLIAGIKQTPLVETPMLQARLEALEAGGQRTVIEVADNVEARIQALESVGLENLPSFISDTTERLDMLDKSTEILHGNQAALMKVHLQMQEDLNVTISSVNTIHNAVVEMQEAETEEAPEPHVMTDWIKPEPTRTEHVASLAKVCVSMSDVLLICRYLKADPEMAEEERIEILHVACQRAGVPVSAGMKARAGVKFIEA
jgi:hypothetical protein